MSIAKRMLEEGYGKGNREIWHIGGCNVPENPFVGHRLKVRWLKAWGKRSPGFEAEGTLLATFAVGGRRLIGELRLDNGKKLSCPWSRQYLAVEVL